MANLFDKTYEELATLQEAFTTDLDAKAFFDGFLASLVVDLQKVLPKTDWHIATSAKNIALNNSKTTTEISAEAAISCHTTDFDLQADFDYTNPIPKSHGTWEMYRFIEDSSNTVKILKDYITNFIGHGSGAIINADNRYGNIKISVISTRYDLEPYAYKYLNKNRPVMISQFGKDLQMDFILKLEYSEALGASANTPSIPTIRVKVDVVSDFRVTYGQSQIATFLDKDFDYEEFNKTTEYKDAMVQSLSSPTVRGLSSQEILNALGFTAPAAKLDCLYELKVSPFEYEDKKNIYPADSYFNGPHYVIYEFTRDTYIIDTISMAYTTVANNFGDALAEAIAHIDYFKVYKRDTAADWTARVNQYLNKIHNELSVQVPPVTSATEYKLKELLNGITWKAVVRGYGSAEIYNGMGYTPELRQLAKDGKTFEKFVVLGGDF